MRGGPFSQRSDRVQIKNPVRVDRTKAGVFTSGVQRFVEWSNIPNHDDVGWSERLAMQTMAVWVVGSLVVSTTAVTSSLERPRSLVTSSLE